MKSTFRRTLFLKFVLTSSISFAAALLISGCSHRSFALALHSHMTIEDPASAAETTDGPIVDKTISASGVHKVVLGVGVGSPKVTPGSSSGIKLHALLKYEGHPAQPTKRLISNT